MTTTATHSTHPAPTAADASCRIQQAVLLTAAAHAAGALPHTHGAAWCLATPGATPGANVHPEGACACFRGGPSPVPARSQAHPALVAHADAMAARIAARRAEIEAAHLARRATRRTLVRAA